MLVERLCVVSTCAQDLNKSGKIPNSKGGILVVPL